MKVRRSLLILALLTPGLGVILLLIGTVVYIAIAQSFGYYSLIGDNQFSTEYWAKTLDRKIYNRSVKYSIYIGILSAIFSVALAYPLAMRIPVIVNTYSGRT